RSEMERTGSGFVGNGHLLTLQWTALGRGQIGRQQPALGLLDAGGDQRRETVDAHLHRVRAARVEPAARRRANEVRRCTRYRVKFLRGKGNRRTKKVLGVRVLRRREELAHRALL